MVFEFLVPMLSAFYNSGLLEIWWIPSIALAFLATVPLILKLFWR